MIGEFQMVVEPALVNSTSVLVGALIGGSASVTAAIYTQRYQDRLQRVAREAAKREAVYADFIMSASKILVRAYLSDRLTGDGDEQRLVGLINRMRLFAPHHVIDEAEAVIRTLVEISLQPRVDLHDLAQASVSDRSAPDLLLKFSLATQADLDNVSRSAVRTSWMARLWRLKHGSEAASPD
jgi:hypothetical protein